MKTFTEFIIEKKYTLEYIQSKFKPKSKKKGYIEQEWTDFVEQFYLDNKISMNDFMTWAKYGNIAEAVDIPKDNIFVMIIGGVASGKSYVYESKFKHLPLLDIDEYTKKLSGGDWEKARKMVSKAIKMVESDLKDYFKEGKSVVNMGTGASTAGVLNKFKWAKEAGMETAIVLVDVPLKTALERNQSRADKGDRNLIPDYKVERTNTDARKNFKEFSKVADYSINIKN